MGQPLLVVVDAAALLPQVRHRRHVRLRLTTEAGQLGGAAAIAALSVARIRAFLRFLFPINRRRPGHPRLGATRQVRDYLVLGSNHVLRVAVLRLRRRILIVRHDCWGHFLEQRGQQICGILFVFVVGLSFILGVGIIHVEYVVEIYVGRRRINRRIDFRVGLDIPGRRIFDRRVD